MSAKERLQEPASTPSTDTITTREEAVRRRAYQLYEMRGRADGHELEDWLQAENEISELQALKAAA